MPVQVILCADGPTLKEPSLMGLEGENVLSLPWLACASTAQECRDTCGRNPQATEAWVVSCDDMSPINLAAALKRDNPARSVRLVSFEQNGSLASRASAAGIDTLYDERAFATAYATVKKRAMLLAPAAKTTVIPSVSAQMPKQQRVVQAPPSEPAVKVSQPATKSASGSQSRVPLVTGTASVRPPAKVAPQPSGRLMPPVKWPQIAPPAGVEAGTVVSVVSASGGCGKSSFAAVFALRCCRRGLSVAVVDADLQFGDMAYLLGAKKPLGMDEAALHPHSVSALSSDKGSGRPVVIAPPERVEDSEWAAAALVPIIRTLQKTFDVVLVNTGAFWNDVQPQIIEASDAVLFMLGQRTSSLRATVRAVELCTRMGLATSSFVFLIGRYTRTGMVSTVDVSCALRGAKAMPVGDGGREVEELLDSGYADELARSKNPLCSAADDAITAVVPALGGHAEEKGKAGKRQHRKWFGRRESSGTV
ncbi:Flp pilus assembly protein, ATPase CpaE [Slackia heliotrinireducens]|nr:Flp pilus assembly protein, ATPase CpaE [Slackia heliotrinireducens]